MLNDFTGDLSVIEKLGDFPNTDDGLSPENLKKKFDEGPKMLGQYLNEELVPAVRALQSAPGGVDAAEVRLHPLSSSQDSVIISAFLNEDETGGVRLDNMFAQDDAFVRGVKDGVEENDAVNLRQLNALSEKIIDTYDFCVFPGGEGYIAEETISDLQAVKAAGRILVCVLETENQQLLSLPMVKEEGGAYHFSAVCEGVEWYVQIDGESNVQVSSEPLGGSAASVVVVEATYNWLSESGSMDEDNLAKIAAGYEAGSCVMLKIGTTLYSFLGPNGDMSNGWVFYNLVDNRLYTVCVQLDGGVYANEKRCFAPDGEGIMEYPETHAIFGIVEVPGDLVLGDNAVYLIAEVDEEQNKTLLHLGNNADTDGDVVLRGVEAGVEDTDAVNVKQLNTKITAPSIAEVGQTLVVKEVDENGKPASWECVDAASGGKGGAEYANRKPDISFTLTEEVTYISSNEVNGSALDAKKIAVLLEFPAGVGDLYYIKAYNSSERDESQVIFVFNVPRNLTDSSTQESRYFLTCEKIDDKYYRGNCICNCGGAGATAITTTNETNGLHPNTLGVDTSIKRFQLFRYANAPFNAGTKVSIWVD